MKYGLIGAKLGHSFSREIHAKIADYPYELAEMDEAALDAFFRAKDFCGVNVTIPYKQTVMRYLDETDEAAALIGAVNTVVNRDGRLYGYNTDYSGAAAMLRHAGLELAGKRVLILGSGGTSKTMCAVARDLGAAEVLTVSRRGGEGTVSYDEAVTRYRDARIIINTTPVGMFPNSDACPIDIDAFDRLEGVADAVYNPLSTVLVRRARARGLLACGGLYMLAAQAVYASALFLGTPVKDGVADEVYRAVRREKQNMVLVGMPSSGKSSVGAQLAQKAGRPFADSDEEIIRRSGKTIPEIFAERGEAGFRALERQVISDLSKQQGMVLATGGGAILNPDNVFDLKANGRLFFLDRPPEKLLSTPDRPLSANRQALEKLYRERKDKYTAAADIRIPGEGTVTEVADLVWEAFCL